MTTPRKVMLLVLGVLLIVSILGLVLLFQAEKAKQARLRQQESRQLPGAGADSLPGVPTDVTQGEVQVKLYFRTTARVGALGLLKPEVRRIPQSIMKENHIRRLVEALVAGPGQGGYRTLPEKAQVRQVYVVDNLAVIDFSSEFATRSPGSVLEELATIYSVVNTVTENTPGVEGVKLLVDGIQRKSLAGHLSLAEVYQYSPEYVVGWKTRESMIQEENLK